MFVCFFSFREKYLTFLLNTVNLSIPSYSFFSFFYTLWIYTVNWKYVHDIYMILLCYSFYQHIMSFIVSLHKFFCLNAISWDFTIANLNFFGSISLVYLVFFYFQLSCILLSVSFYRQYNIGFSPFKSN